MKKRILAICLATSMVFSLIGCGNKEEKEGKNPSTEVQESSSVEEVVEVNPKEWKLKLSIKKYLNEEERKSFEKYLNEEDKPTTLGDVFKDSLK